MTGVKTIYLVGNVQSVKTSSIDMVEFSVKSIRVCKTKSLTLPVSTINFGTVRKIDVCAI
jgi:hypothetical protein